METQDIKRGVDFDTRFGAAAVPFRQAFLWWNRGGFGKRTFLFLTLIWCLNLFIIYPLFLRDLSQAYSASPFLIMISEFFRQFIHIPTNVFFTVISFLSITFAPVSFYLFVRKNAMRHEITALLAALLYILPSPLFGNTPVLAASLLKGDGAHVFIFSFMPLFLLYIQSFLATGAPAQFFLSVMGFTLIAIISPFAALNLLIIYAVAIMAEGFQGNMRIKIIRACLVLAASALLSFFWYYPGYLIKIIAQPDFQDSISKILGILPAAIPVIPVAGALSFLIFDRRKRLKPVFISLSLLLIYITLYKVSGFINIERLFSPARFLPELVLSSSFFLAIIFIFLIEPFRNHVLSKIKGRLKFVFVIFFITFAIGLIIISTVQGLAVSHDYISSERIVSIASVGGASHLFVDIHDPSSVLAIITSCATFFGLIFILRKQKRQISGEK